MSSSRAGGNPGDTGDAVATIKSDDDDDADFDDLPFVVEGPR